MLMMECFTQFRGSKSLRRLRSVPDRARTTMKILIWTAVITLCNGASEGIPVDPSTCTKEVIKRQVQGMSHPKEGPSSSGTCTTDSESSEDTDAEDLETMKKRHEDENKTHKRYETESEALKQRAVESEKLATHPSNQKMRYNPSCIHPGLEFEYALDKGQRIELGKGGDATVYLAHRKGSPTEHYAVKVVSRMRIDEDPAERNDRIEREIQIQKELSGSPGILRLYTWGKDENNFYLILDLMRTNLKQHVLENGLLPLPRVQNYMNQLAHAVQACHEKDVGFYDIKLENLLLDYAGNLVLGDFGFANFNNRRLFKFEKKDRGTPRYVAPEIIRLSLDLQQKKPMESLVGFGREADIWAMAVVWYKLLVGDDDDSMDDVLKTEFLHYQDGSVLKSLRDHLGKESERYLAISDPEKDLLNRMQSRLPRDRPKITKIIEDFGKMDMRDGHQPILAALEEDDDALGM